ADNILIERWRPLIATTAKLKIGFCWQGSKTYGNAARRDCPLTLFLFLCHYANILPVSLQKDVSDADKVILKQYNIVDAGSAINDFADTAAIIAQLDIIISVDTANMHLAGAMGKPVWLLLPFQTEWRHPRGEATSPWYQNVLFFRQPILGDWSSVFQLAERNLQAYMQLNM
ncbi:MAG: glycosyltransferase family 9 protein, partial [Gammaproteobacteria bacterium]